MLLRDKIMISPPLSQNIPLFLRVIPLLLCRAVNLPVEDVDVIAAMAQRRNGDVGVTAGWMEVCKTTIGTFILVTRASVFSHQP